MNSWQVLTVFLTGMIWANMVWILVTVYQFRKDIRESEERDAETERIMGSWATLLAEEEGES